ncbi:MULTISPECIES: hypothetical protein [unclassified Paenibacillus]|uniref:hypothetical protein n=1 Tax=unclassified Paenibacillus TaxID=185978 RepID=UPI001C1153FD|nr:MULTISPECIES: hypothetical protein [unclassified Paenibacillus]MBU5442400.1 hypothetical protein [Paenibacillus sp. MSJ-34]CAH0119436.1 hypothetical protein PAE9249_01939 [Paenibacillus sp. CECT 9249]
MGRRRSPNPRLCNLEGCNERHYAKGVCKRHYHQFRRIEGKQSDREDMKKLQATS